jgi:hypothetical protein
MLKCRKRMERPGGGGLKRPRPRLGCSIIEEAGKVGYKPS